VTFQGFGYQDKGWSIAHHNALTNPSWAVACAGAVLRHAAASGARLSGTELPMANYSGALDNF